MTAQHALGRQFEMPRHITVQRDDVVDTHDPKSCAGRCDEVSEQVQGAGGLRGASPWPSRVRLLHPDGNKEHVVVAHKGHVIDYTLRQFEPEADVPHIEPIKQYMRKRGYTGAVKDR